MASQAFISCSPNRSGRLSASRPGKPRKVSSFKLPKANTCSPPRASFSGIINGATSSPLLVKARSYWKRARCSLSSQITTPTARPQSFTFACVTMCSSWVWVEG